MRWVVGVVACQCIIGCSAVRTPPAAMRDPQIDDHAQLARAAFATGEYDRALQLYERVLKRAYFVDDVTEAGNASYNMAVCYLRLDMLEEAAAALLDARAEFERCGADTTDVLLVQSKLETRRGHLDRAQELADEVLSVDVDDSRRWQAILIRGHLACDRENADAARKALEITANLSVSDPAALAFREQLVGRVLSLEDEHDAAAAAFDREAELYRNARHFRSMALALARAGEAYRRAGRETVAADRFLRSQRSLDAQ